MPNQYANPQNAEAHFRTTGPEIWKQTEGRITHLFVSLGTCGTVVGTSRFLRSRKPDLKVIAVQPTEDREAEGGENYALVRLLGYVGNGGGDEPIPAQPQTGFKSDRRPTDRR